MSPYTDEELRGWAERAATNLGGGAIASIAAGVLRLLEEKRTAQALTADRFDAEMLELRDGLAEVSSRMVTREQLEGLALTVTMLTGRVDGLARRCDTSETVADLLASFARSVLEVPS